SKTKQTKNAPKQTLKKFTVLCNLKIFLIIKHENASFLFIILEKETFLKVFLKIVLTALFFNTLKVQREYSLCTFFHK
ncbi:hypothetical protein R6231_17535, partial [Bacillus cytotoxicus]|uniref:hypothetical protein n=1 Tax=Bacillus cytotoxicus TaxID=580165 RepID=UPI002FE54C7A